MVPERHKEKTPGVETGPLGEDVDESDPKS